MIDQTVSSMHRGSLEAVFMYCQTISVMGLITISLYVRLFVRRKLDLDVTNNKLVARLKKLGE